MARIFRLLLMAAQGGVRYLRAICHFVVGLTAKATTAPGSDMGADIETVPPEVNAQPVSRPVADMALSARAGGATVVSNIVAWLVSIARLDARTEVRMTTNILAAPAAAVTSICKAVVRMVCNGEAAPGVPVECKTATIVSMTAGAESAPPVAVKADVEAALPMADAMATSATPEPMAAAMEASPLADAVMSPGSPADARAEIQATTATVIARIHTWRGPTRDGTYLHIPQVYTYERVGNQIYIK